MPYTSIVLTCAIISPSLQNPEPRLDGNEIMRVLEGLHAPLKDFEFVCEGETKWLVDTSDMHRDAPDNSSGRFQGVYAYRQDGAAYWDQYLKPFDPRADFQHNTFAQLKGRWSRIFRTPDHRRPYQHIEVGLGSPTELGAPVSPQLFIYLGYWRRLRYSTKDIAIESLDWDEINGHRTLRLTIDEHPRGPSNKRAPAKRWSKYWIDLKRGGHVLKHERYRGSKLIARTDKIVLASLRSPDGQQIWLPVHGEFDTFFWLKGYSDKPLFHEAYDVVNGSVVLNRGLTDERFSVERKGHKADTPDFKKIRQKFESPPPKPDEPQLRTDPVGVQEYQEKRLAEADRQAKQLDASPPARRGWDSDTLAQAGLAVLGVGILIVAIVLRRRVS